MKHFKQGPWWLKVVVILVVSYFALLLSGPVPSIPSIFLFGAGVAVGASLIRAMDDAHSWLQSRRQKKYGANADPD